MRWLLRLYPAAWRQRYGEEFLSLLETERHGLRLYVDVVLGAIDAWLRPQLERTSRVAVAGGRPRRIRDRFDRFTPASRSALKLADMEAHLLRHGYIGAEHLLLGLLHEPDSIASQVLQNLGVRLDDARAEVDARSAKEPARTQLRGLTAEAKQVIELSVAESNHLRDGYVGTEHMLLGLMSPEEGVAADIVAKLAGVTVDEARLAVKRLVNQQREDRR